MIKSKSTNSIIGTGLKTLSKIQDGSSVGLLQLTNDSHVIPCNEEGKGNYETCETLVEFYFGNEKQEGIKNIKANKSKGITKSTFVYDEENKAMKFSIQEITEKEVYVDFVYKDKNETEYTARFTVSKIRNGSSNYLIDLTNDNHTFVADEKGKITPGANNNITTKVMVYKGTTLQKIVKPITFEPTSINGLSYSIQPGTNIINISAKEGTALPDSGALDIIVKIDDVTDGKTQEIELRKAFSFSKTRYGLATASLELTNDSHVVPCDIESGRGNFDTCRTEPIFYIGNKNSGLRAKANPSSGVVGKFLSNGNVYKVDSMSTDEGYVDFSIERDGATYTSRFTISKIRNGNDNIYMDLTNDNHTFAADASGKIPARTEITTTVLAYKGTKEIEPHNIKINKIQNVKGFSSKGAGTNTATLIALEGSDMATTGTIGISAEITYRENAQDNHVTLTKAFSYSKLKEGKGIDNVIEYYVASTVSVGVEAPPIETPEATAPNISGKWDTKIPTNFNTTNKFLWNYERIVYNDLDTIIHTKPAMIGTFSDNGEGVEVQNYYVATSLSEADKVKKTFPYDTETQHRDWKLKNAPMISESLPYLWNFERVFYKKKNTNNNEYTTIRKEVTEPSLIGKYGENGNKVLVADTYEREYSKEKWIGYGNLKRPMTWTSINNAGKFRPQDIMVVVGKAIISDTERVDVSLYATVIEADSVKQQVKSLPISLIMGGEKGEPGDRGPAGPRLDWIDDWDGKTVIVDTDGKRIITPKLFVGKLEGDPNSWDKPGPKIPTGIALGTKMLGSESGAIGLAGYKSGKKTFHLDVNGDLVIGDDSLGGSGYLKYVNNKFELSADSITLKSSNINIGDSLDNAHNKIDNMVIGGMNLYPDSAKEISMERYRGFRTAEVLKKYVGETITVSFDMKANPDGAEGKTILIYAYQGSGISIGDGAAVYPTKKYQRFNFTTTVVNYGKPDPSYTDGEIAFYDSVGGNNCSYTIKNFKIEIGNKATSWSPSPLDTDAEISSIKQQITPDSIVTSVSTSLEGKGKITTTTSIFDKNGLTIKNGGFKIVNGGDVDSPVIKADTDGTLIVGNNKVKLGSDGINIFDNGSFNMYAGSTTDSKRLMWVSDGNLQLAGNVVSSATIKGGYLQSSDKHGDTLFDLTDGYIYTKHQGSNVGKMGRSAIADTEFRGMTLAAERRCYTALSSRTGGSSKSYILGVLVTGDYQEFENSDGGTDVFCNGVNIMRNTYCHSVQFWEVHAITFDSQSENRGFTHKFNWVGRASYGGLTELAVSSDENLLLGHTDGKSFSADLIVNRNTTRMYSDLSLGGRTIKGAKAVLNDLKLSEISPLAELDEDGNPTSYDFNLVKTTQNLTEYIDSIDIEANTETYVPLREEVFYNKYMVLLTPIGENKVVNVTRKEEDGFYIKGDACTVDYNIKFMNELSLYGIEQELEEAPICPVPEDSARPVYVNEG